MFAGLPENLVYSAAGSFVLGMLVCKLITARGSRSKSTKGDERDSRIRPLEAERRIAKTELDKTQASLDLRGQALEEFKEQIATRDNLIADQQAQIRQLREDLKSSVAKTRELRTELSERAEQNVRSEVRLRDVETELSVAQASSDMIATGVLDYSEAPEKQKG